MESVRTVVAGSVGKVGWLVPLMLVLHRLAQHARPRAQRPGRPAGRRLGRPRLRRARHRPHRQRQPAARARRRQRPPAGRRRRRASWWRACCSTCCGRRTSWCRCWCCCACFGVLVITATPVYQVPHRLARAARPAARPHAAPTPTRTPTTASRPSRSGSAPALARGRRPRPDIDPEMGDPAYDSPVARGPRGRATRRARRPTRRRRRDRPRSPARRRRERRRARAAAAHPAARSASSSSRCPATSPTRCRPTRCSSPGSPHKARSKASDDGRRAAHPGDGGVRHRRPGHGLHPRPDRDPLRGRGRPGGQGREGHRAVEEHRLRRRLGRRADPQPDPRQVRDRHRDPQPRQGDRLARRRAPLRHGPLRPPPDGGRARQGRRGRLRGRQPREDAAPAGRRRHRLRQVELHQLDDHLAADAVHARRGADDHGRPQAGRAERLRGHPAPDHPDHHQPQEGRRGAGVGRARDGHALRRPGQLRLPPRRRLQQGGAGGQGHGAAGQRARADAVPLSAW